MIPYLRTAVLKKLQELGDHDVQRTIQHVTVQDLGRVLADLLQGSKRSLREKIKKGVEKNNRECDSTVHTNTRELRFHNSVILPGC